MNTEKLKEIVVNSDLPEFQKRFTIGFIERSNETEKERSEVRLLIEQVANEKRLSEVVLSADEVKIYTVYGKDELDIKYPYRCIFANSKGVWERVNTVCPSMDLAYLYYLEAKYLGINSQFASFAVKMLGINTE